MSPFRQIVFSSPSAAAALIPGEGDSPTNPVVKKGVKEVKAKKGKIKLTNINNYRKIALYSPDDNLLDEAEAEYDYIKGYVFEFESCANAIAKGLIQAPEMPWSRTIRIAQINDIIRSMM